MKSGLTTLAITCGVLACATPSYAESRLATVRYAKVGLHLGEDGIRQGEATLLDTSDFVISTTNDREWQLTMNGCVLNIIPDEANFTDDEKLFQKSFIQGFSQGNNPNGHQMVFSGKATFVRQLKAEASQPFPCNNEHIYWVGILRMPVLPGAAGIILLPLDGYKSQDTSTLIGVVKPDTFLKDQSLTADELGPVTAALSRAIH